MHSRGDVASERAAFVFLGRLARVGCAEQRGNDLTTGRDEGTDDAAARDDPDLQQAAGLPLAPLDYRRYPFGAPHHI